MWGKIIFRIISGIVFLLIATSLLNNLHRVYLKKKGYTKFHTRIVQAVAVGYALVVSLVLAMEWY